MLKCKDCGKEFATRNSLTRHAHRHKSQTRHACEQCSVSFYRRDLLTRHSRLHERQTSDAAEPQTPSNAGLGRKRCHTACSRCRERRIKCDGELPCASCAEAEQECTYSLRGFRESKRMIVSTENDAEPTQEMSFHLSPPSTVQPSIGADSIRCDEGALGESEMNADIFNVMDFSWMNAGNDYMAWPELHENLFLQDETYSTSPHTTLPLNFFSQTLEQSQPNVQCNTAAFSQSQLQSVSETDKQRHGTTIASLNDAIGLYDMAPTLGADISGSSNRSQTEIVDEMVKYASTVEFWSKPREARCSFWRSQSTKLARAFEFDDHASVDRYSHSLDYFVELYMEHFSPLWPLLTRQNLQVTALHPLLYLVLTSIGAMYAGRAESSYATMIHKKIRISLTRPWELDYPSDDLLWLGQARLLTQVAALYFGQVKAFSIAQHLGALLLAQARRMGIFTEASNPALTMAVDPGTATPRSEVEAFALWLYHESRRRLALGIVRADTFTSVLLSAKPIITLEEVDLFPPACDAVWAAREMMSPHLCLQLIRQDQSPDRNIWLSDLYRIAMDRNEFLPALSPSAYEFLMFGLHGQVWRFRQDTDVMGRLCGHRPISLASDVETRSGINSKSPFDSTNGRNQTFSQSILGAERLDGPVRRMMDFTSDKERLFSALEDWKAMLPYIRTVAQTTYDRSRLLSSILLYHLSYICLLAPVGDLHLLQYQLVDNRPVEHRLAASIAAWAKTTQARTAAEHACTVWSLIHTECRRSEHLRANFNILAFTGLHHAGIVLWCYGYKGTENAICATAGVGCLHLVDEGSREKSIPIHHAHSEAILESFAQLYDCISPTRWSQFAKAALALSKHRFPSLDTT